MEEILEYAKASFDNGAAKTMSERQFKALFDKEYSSSAYDLSNMRASIMYAEYFYDKALISENGVFFKILEGMESLLNELKRKTILNTAIDGYVLSGEVDGGGKIIAYHPQASTAITKYMEKALDMEKE